MSSKAILTLLLVVVSGSALAVIQIRQFDALWTTDYGLVLSAKLVAVAVLIAIVIGTQIRSEADDRALSGP